MSDIDKLVELVNNIDPETLDFRKRRWYRRAQTLGYDMPEDYARFLTSMLIGEPTKS